MPNTTALQRTGFLLIQRYRNDFNKKTGGDLMQEIRNAKDILSLETIQELVNMQVPHTLRKKGIFSLGCRTRKAEIIDLRKIFCYIAGKQGYDHKAIARAAGISRSVVCYHIAFMNEKMHDTVFHGYDELKAKLTETQKSIDEYIRETTQPL